MIHPLVVSSSDRNVSCKASANKSMKRNSRLPNYSLHSIDLAVIRIGKQLHAQ
jgi:hypothetical protein